MENRDSSSLRKTIVVSAVNLNRGGTLRILRECLGYLSVFAAESGCRVVAIVYKKELADFPHIEYIETQWPKKRWINRLWYEYVSLRKVAQQLQPITLWLSLHDTTPSVQAERRAVYCHNSFPFLKWDHKDLFFAPQIVAFALFSRFFYQKNIRQNDYLVVQQEWFREAFVRMFRLPFEKIIVAPPQQEEPAVADTTSRADPEKYVFIYPAIGDSHKNIECVCAAAEILWKKGIQHFELLLTISGTENRYTKWLHQRWGKGVPALRFLGYLERETLYQYYQQADCLLFPSKVETWGLPISEFAAFKKPMLLADLPYARETAKGNSEVAFFPTDKPQILAEQMQAIIAGNRAFLQAVEREDLKEPVVHAWKALFEKLLEQ